MAKAESMGLIFPSNLFNLPCNYNANTLGQHIFHFQFPVRRLLNSYGYIRVKQEWLRTLSFVQLGVSWLCRDSVAYS